MKNLSDAQGMTHGIRCQCGSLSGEVRHPRHAIHAVCYCIDCRTYAFHLGKSASILDALGGTEVIATQARYVTFTGGINNLACLSLSPNGTLRWYAKCCNTPIANTPRDWHLPYVSLIHTGLIKPLENSFPAVQMHVKTKSAKGKPPHLLWRKITALAGFIPKFAVARLAGTYKQTPFFLQSGAPRVDVQVLTHEQQVKSKNDALM